jgi:ATP-dependent Lhr-like helicase
MALSGFHPVVRRWFEERLGAPTDPQREGWPLIRRGLHTLIAAPTGTGKTLAAFLWALDGLLRKGPALSDATEVLYVSPLKALGNDVQRNLRGPLDEIRLRDIFLPELRVLVRTGDTPSSERQAMVRRPPHILVTTPESLYILLTSEGGRRMLRTVRTAIVDEIHAVTGDKRGSHLALSLERLEALAGPVQRIGLSATQKPLDEVGRFLVGAGRDCALVDAGHRRTMDLAVEVPPSPLETVCSHETWEEIYARVAELVRAHRTTLVFVNTRRLAERVAARLTHLLGEDAVATHHGSLSRARRLDAEQRLKEGRLRTVVATASLELGIDVGDVDLAIQLGGVRSVATFLQRAGRAGHGVGRVPKARLFPLTIDELVEAAALLRAVRRGVLDRTPQPRAPLDILAQQVVAACVAEPWGEDDLYGVLRRAWPYRDLAREDFDAVLRLHADGRAALLHRDGVHGRVRATKRARIPAVTSGGAIPDTADYAVLEDPAGTLVGTVNEDFAVESSAGDVFQLGNTSWRIRRIEAGVLRVQDAKGAPPTIPVWFGEAPSRTAELSRAVGEVREECDGPEWLEREGGLPPAAALQAAEFLAAGRKALGTVPTHDRVVLERFFDESGGMQMVLHAPFGGRINRAWGIALRKRFCRGFGFELQAAANEDAVVVSLGPHHSFALDEVFDYLHPNTALALLEQALLDQPMWETRWRWNCSRSLLVPRMRGGKRTPAPLVRMFAQDLMVKSFPQAQACPETLASEDREIPRDHPLVRQTLEDCLHEAMDSDGFLEVLRRLRDGSLERRAADLPEPSPFARSILAARPYAFLDDAPLEERRTQAVLQRRLLDVKSADDIGALDPGAVERVREEAWPRPADAEEVHEALLWMGYATEEEGAAWGPWLEALRGSGRVRLDGGRWWAAESTRDPVETWRGRLEALGPVFADDPALLELERRGVALRVRLEGRQAWCDRRLLARIHRYTVDRLRREIEPATATEFLRFLACWQNADEEHRLEGPRGVAEVVRRLAGFEVPARAWEASLLPLRVRDYRREWLDQATLSGEAAWGRLWGSGAAAVRTTPVSLVLREDLDRWRALAPPADIAGLSSGAALVEEALRARGAMFPQELAKATRLLPVQLEGALGELIGAGRVTCDSFGALRWLVVPASKRKVAATVGRWSLFREVAPASDAGRASRGAGAAGGRESGPPVADAGCVEFVAGQLLRRWGVVFRTALARERIPVPWRDILRVLRTMELRGEVRGGRFVQGFSGEQYALPEAVPLLRAVRRRGALAPVEVSAADPLNFTGVLVPGERVPPAARRRVAVA